MYGKIIKAVSGFYYVRTEGYSLVECNAKGSFKHNNVTPLVGDDVQFEVTDAIKMKGTIVDVYPRFNELTRPNVSNVDQAMVVFAIKSPNPNLSILDRFLCLMKKQGIPTIIVFNKKDLAMESEIKELKNTYKNSGCKVYVIAAGVETGKGMDLLFLRHNLQKKTTVMAGPSGVGKSTLLNVLANGSTEIAPTGSISEKVGRGKHTTRHNEIYWVSKKVHIVDTPGFTSLLVSPEDYTKETLQDAFPEFDPYKGQCKYRNCTHIKERDCAVEKAVQEGKIPTSRYNSYKSIFSELKSQQKY
ncbi:MAG: ribosome small subunit-dependent GTPase A [Lachnospiraceae bacterium]|nr:ribosome small subunit-dependent GTPase A [Lachnospiraceae bacterium]